MRRPPELGRQIKAARPSRKAHYFAAGLLLATLSASGLAACGGSTSLGTFNDGLGEGELCPSDRCNGQEHGDAGACPDHTHASYTCRSNGRGVCKPVLGCVGEAPGSLGDAGAPVVCPLDASENAIVPSDATKLVATSPGGALAVPLPAGSQCHPQYARYVVDLDAKAMAWDTCDTVASNEPYVPSHGESILSDAQVRTIKGVFACLKRVDTAPCTDDASLDVVEVTTPSGTTKYSSATNCAASAPKIAGTRELFSSMRNALH